MHRSKSKVLSRLDRESSHSFDDTNNMSNKKSLWGTIKSKRRGHGVDDLQKKNTANSLHRLPSISGSSSSTTLNSHLDDSTATFPKVASRHNGVLSNFSGSTGTSILSPGSALSSSSSAPSTPSPKSSRPVSMISPSSFKYSLDPNSQNGSKVADSAALTSTNNLRSSTSQSSRRHQTDRKSKRISRMFDSDFFNGTDDAIKETKLSPKSPTPTTTTTTIPNPNPSTVPTRKHDRNTSKRHSVMFGKSTMSSDFLKSLQQIPSNEEKGKQGLVNHSDFVKDADNKRLSVTFEDYKLLLQAYGDDNEEFSKMSSSNTDENQIDNLNINKNKINIKLSSTESSISSSFNTKDLDEQLDSNIEIKLISNCVCIGSHESSIFDHNGKPIVVNAKFNNIDIKVNDDLNSIFDEEDDVDEYNRDAKHFRKVQRTSLYFT